MQSMAVGGVTIRPLRNGERSAVQAVFDRLGPRSRLHRFGGAKNVLLPSDLDLLARVDATHHALVALVGGEPVGIARLVRDGDTAEVAFAVADEWQGRGIGSLLVDRLGTDARAAGIRRLTGTLTEPNPRSLALLCRLRARVVYA